MTGPRACPREVPAVPARRGGLAGSVLAVGAFNHQDGGIDAGSYDRLDAQLEVIAPLTLDVLLSSEGKGWLDRGRAGLHRAARRLGMTPLVAPAPRHDCNLVIFVRTGRLAVLEERHASGHPWWHAQARAVVQVPGLAAPLWLAAAHFAPFSPDIRLAEAYATTELGGRPAILGGDWNDEGTGDAPVDWAALPGWKAVRHHPHAGLTAAAILARAGFTDAATAACPADRQPTAGFGRAPVRCDRIYLSALLPGRVTGYQVTAMGGLSDHHLVTARIALNSPDAPPAAGIQETGRPAAAGRPGALTATPARCLPGCGPPPGQGGEAPGTRHGRRHAAAGMPR
jgi:hypothetical protein